MGRTRSLFCGPGMPSYECKDIINSSELCMLSFHLVSNARKEMSGYVSITKRSSLTIKTRRLFRQLPYKTLQVVSNTALTHQLN